MDPVELAKQLEQVAASMLEQSLQNAGDLVPGLYETKGRAAKAVFDLETALAVNALRRQAAGLRASAPAVHARALRRAKELLKSQG